MSLQQISKQLQRDLKKNPKKAGMLAMLALVCVWFWLPLIFGGKDESSTPVVAAPVEAPAVETTTTTTSSTTSTAASALPWRDVVKLRESDPRTKAIDLAATVELGRSPFGYAPAVLAHLKKQEEALAAKAKEKENKPAEAPIVDKTPAELGLSVSSTIFGGQRPTASINNKVYRTGDMIQAKTGELFTLVSVHRDHVVLERDGKPYDLAIKTNSSVFIQRTDKSGNL